MPRRVSVLLKDINDYAELCFRYTSGKTYLAFANDDRLQAAVERCLGIVGEALSQAVKQDPLILASITDGPRIISLRHRLIHGYYDISEAIVWGVIQQHLPVLDLEIKALRETYSTEFSEDGAEQ